MNIEIKNSGLWAIFWAIIFVAYTVGVQVENNTNAVQAQTKAITSLSQHTIVYTGNI